MSLFDAFTGKAAKQAAAKNYDIYSNLKPENLGYLDKGLEGSLGALDQANVPFEALAAKYGKGGDLYLDATGANGQDGLTRAKGIFTSTPGYTEGLDMSLDALDRRAASRGMLASGNTVADTTDLATNYANQKYGDFVSRLAPTISPEVAGIQGQANTSTAAAGLIANDASQRVNVANTTAAGQSGANTAIGQAEQAGSANLWNFLLNGAKLGAGFWGYNTGSSKVA